MQNQSSEKLNQKLAVEDFLLFKEGVNGFIYADIENDSGSAKIFMHRAQLTSYIPRGQEPVIFLISKSLLDPGKSIIGVIPISWSWFVDHPTDKANPAHSFVRTSEWEVRATEQISTGETKITLGFRDNKSRRALWDYSFDLEIAISFGNELKLELNISSTEKSTITDAFHSYYNVGNIDQVSILGLEDTIYVDKAYNFTTKKQYGVIKIVDETDRIYLDTKNECVVEDKALYRKIRISKNGSNSTVLWNPWSEKARAMKDLGDEDYCRFVCVETTNAGTDIIIALGEKHVLGLNIPTENIET